jgi:hypothetical protein
LHGRSTVLLIILLIGLANGVTASQTMAGELTTLPSDQGVSGGNQ